MRERIKDREEVMKQNIERDSEGKNKRKMNVIKNIGL